MPQHHHGSAPHVFFSHAVGVDTSAITLALAEAGLSYEDSWVLPLGASSPGHLLRDRIRNADLLLAIADPQTPTVLYEIGVAAGAGTPVLIVADPGEQLPVLLRDLPIVPEDAAPAELVAAIRQVIESSQLEQSASGVGGPVLSREELAAHLSTLRTGDSTSLEEVVTAVLKAAGASVRMDYHVGADLARPDLVIWHDGLHHRLGTPLPIELLSRPTSYEALVPRLRHVREEAGTRSVLGIAHRGNLGKRAVSADSLGRIVLFVEVVELLEELTRQDLPSALSAILGSAVALDRP